MASVIPCAYSQHLYLCLFQEAQLNEVLSASNLDPSALTMVTRKLEVGMQDTWQVFLLSSVMEYNVILPSTGCARFQEQCNQRSPV